jgi:uncharacterized repeat protein (TIGR01451 family)
MSQDAAAKRLPIKNWASGQRKKVDHMRRLTLLASLAIVLCCTIAGSAVAATPHQDIASTGPLTHVYIGNDLSCQVAHTADTVLEFFPSSVIPGDCGTFLAVGGNLYAPDFANHGGTATGGLGSRIPFTPVSQSGVTGTGTSADPFRVLTTVDVGATGLRIDESDVYVVGDESYRTQITVTNTTAAALSLIVYRAGDCFLGGSDFGYGFTETFGARNAVGCSVNPGNSPPGRIEEWVPLTGGNNFYQNRFSSVWSQIGTKTSFPDTCACSTLQDNGAGISWAVTIAAAASAVFTHDTVFSPSGLEPLAMSKTADSPTSPPGGPNGYTITISNPNPDPVLLSSIVDDLPAGFTYTPGSTTGVTTADPTISGQTLTWSGSFSVPANGSASLHFSVQVAGAPGDYFNNARAVSTGGYTVLPTGDTAKITVTAATFTMTLDPPTASNPTGTPHTVTATLRDGSGTPVFGATIQFTVTGANTASSTGTTDASGIATFTYTGTSPGDDIISACYDADTPPCDATASALKTWVAANADLSIVKSGPALVQNGSNMTYNLEVSNGGPATATNVVVTDPLPTGTTFVSASAGCTESAGTVTCTIASLPSGASQSFSITVNVNTSANSVTDTASVTADQEDPDPSDNQSSVTTQVNHPPDCSSLTIDGPSMWPPNHKLRSFTVSGGTDPDGNPVAILITSVFQDEPVNGTGDGDTSPDAVITSANTVDLRGERSGNLNGRVYYLRVTLSDNTGASCSTTLTVGVPHDQGPQGGPVGEGPLYNSTVA